MPRAGVGVLMASLLTRGLQSLSLLGPAMVRFAGKKAGGTGGVSRSSNPKYMGIKVHGDQIVKAGGIIYRQRGAKCVLPACQPRHAES